MNIQIKFERFFDFFLAKERQGGDWFDYPLTRRSNVKDIIESLGVPHTEIGQLYFNNTNIDFQYIPVSEGRLKVCSVSQPFGVLSPSYLRPEPLKKIKFIADVNVIKLGRLMRLTGFDVAYSPSYSDSVIADIAFHEKRIVLSRDTMLFKRKKIVFGKRIRADLPYEQFGEVMDFFGIADSIEFFSRCANCNIRLESVDKKDIMHRLEPKTKKYFHVFFQCPECRNIFWRGSHYENLREIFCLSGIIISA